MNEHVWISMNQAYPQLVKIVTTNGQPYKPRGFECREMRPFAFSILQPELSLYTGESRNLNLRFWAVETLSYLAGFGTEKWHAELLCKTNSKMQEFINPTTGLFDGAYGPRILRSIFDIIELLRADPDTRQAVMSIWSPGIPKESKDVPCTVMLHFFRDNDTLSCASYMRSNDLNWGTPYDVPAFCAILGFVAHFVGLEPGEYTHMCGSLHAYQTVPGGPRAPKVSPDDDFHVYKVPMDWGTDTPAGVVRKIGMYLFDVYRRGWDMPSYRIPRWLIPWAYMIQQGKLCESSRV